MKLPIVSSLCVRIFLLRILQFIFHLHKDYISIFPLLLTHEKNKLRIGNVYIYIYNLIFGAIIEHLDSYSGTLYFGQLSHCRSTHFQLDRLIPDCLGHIIVLNTSLGVSCNTLSSEKTTDNDFIGNVSSYPVV